MSIKLATILTKTIAVTTPDGLDAAIKEFLQVGGARSGGIREEQLVSIEFAVAPTTPSPTYAVLITYTS